MIVEVYGNNVEKALKILKRQMQKQGITKDVKKNILQMNQKMYMER